MRQPAASGDAEIFRAGDRALLIAQTPITLLIEPLLRAALLS